MNVLSPNLLWIEGRCYRLPELDSESSEASYRNIENNEWLENETNFLCEAENIVEDNDENEDLEQLIETVSEGRLKLKYSIPETFWPQIIGSKGVTKKRIEFDTKTKIIIPRPMEHGDVEIRGSSKKNIILAKKCIDVIVSSSRDKFTFTHFISIPINNEEIKKNFLIFKEEVIKYFGNDRGVEESIFQNPDKLHLTIGTLVLTDQNERKIAGNILNEVYNKTIKPMLENIKVEIEMRGIEYMNDDPSEVDVLYGKIASEPDKNLLQQLANIIVDNFTQHKLMRSSERQNVKLHITLMNSLFRDEEPEEINEEIRGLNTNKRTKKARNTFNAVNILEKFQDFYFGKQLLKTIELSVRYSTSKDGYYKSSCVVNL